MTEFELKFAEETKNKYKGALRYVSSEYEKNKDELKIKFIYDSRFSYINEDEKSNIEAVCKKIVSHDKVLIEYMRVYGDRNSIIQSFLRFIKQNYSTIYNILSDEDIIVDAEDKKVEITARIQQTYYKIFEEKLLNILTSYLEKEYVQDIKIIIHKIPDREITEEISSGDYITEQIISRRHIPFNCRQKIIGKKHIGGINRNGADYISDVKEGSPNQKVVVCGKITQADLIEYISKDEKIKMEHDSTYEPQKKKFLKFYLSDTTEVIECTMFYNNEDKKRLGEIVQGAQIVLEGRTGIYNSKINITADAIFYADINYEKIDLKQGLPAPKHYQSMSPLPYSVSVQGTLGGLKEMLDNFTKFNIVIFDLETSGLDILKDEVIEFAALKISGGKVIEKMDGLFNPGRELKQEVAEKTHITDSMLVGKPHFSDAIGDVVKFFGDAIICGHNIDNFDVPFIKKYYKPAGYVFNNKTIDTLMLARKYFKLSKYNLEFISEAFNFPNKNAHRALSDVETTYKVLLKLIENGYMYDRK